MAVAIVLSALVAGVPAWLLFPPKTPPMPSDVVVVIAGASDGRHELGAQLVEKGVAENFVVSNPAGTRDKIGSAHCRGDDQPEAAIQTWCLRPKPVKTTGEALTMGKLAVQEGWSTATVVTSRTHARRVYTMFKQCGNLDAQVVFVEEGQGVRVKDRVLHEIGAYLKFWLTNPC